MRITKVTYRTVADTNRSVIGACVVVLEDQLMLHDIMIVESTNGRYVAMPGRSLRGKSKGNARHSDDVFHPVKTEFHRYFKDTVLAGFEKYEKDKTRFMFFPE